jgi:hypothetical protein
MDPQIRADMLTEVLVYCGLAGQPQHLEKTLILTGPNQVA